MNDNSTHTQLLIRYLDGELDEQEATKLREQLENSPAWKEELESLQIARMAVQRYGLKNDIARVRSEMINSTDNTARVIPFYRRPMSVAAAIILIALVSALYFYFGTSSQEFYATHFASYTVGVTRGTSASPLTKAYEQKDYKQVNALFAAQAQPRNEDYFFFALSLLEQNKARDASVFFETILQEKSPDSTGSYREEAEYYLSLTYIQLHQPKKAIPLFEKIRNDKFHHYHDKVTWMDMWRLKMLDWKN